LATRSIALRFGRGAMVGDCKLAGRATSGVAMAPLLSDIRESDRRGAYMLPCTDAGREGEPYEPDKLEGDRATDGPIGGRN